MVKLISSSNQITSYIYKKDIQKIGMGRNGIRPACHSTPKRARYCAIEPEPALLNGPKRNAAELNRVERAGAGERARM